MRNKWRPIPGHPGYLACRSGKIAGTRQGFRVLGGSVNSRGYLRVQIYASHGKRKWYFVHYLVCLTFHGPRPRGRRPDHRNRKRLDCRARNLRWLARDRNQQNRGPVPETTSRFKGVSWHTETSRWRAKIKRRQIGSFISERAAAKAYDAAAKRLYGEFAYLNFPGRRHG